jgi:hypothetical protein
MDVKQLLEASRTGSGTVSFAKQSGYATWAARDFENAEIRVYERGGSGGY